MVVLTREQIIHDFGQEIARLRAENEHLTSTLAEYEQILAQGRDENQRLNRLLKEHGIEDVQPLPRS